MSVSSLLLKWYDKNRRSFIFRGTRDPYKIWVSEIMLQQTRTETAEPYFERFLSLFPTVFDLADAPEEEVLKAWEGLGYYSRARNLRAAAQTVAYELKGKFPETAEELKKLKGIGPYTACAVSSIAFDEPVPAMDGNLTRVFARIKGIRENVEMPSVKKELYQLAKAEMPQKRSGDMNQALMDLGATVCVAGTPDCEKCPLRTLCNAYEEGDADLLPVKSVKKAPRPVDVAVMLITCKNKILMHPRKETLLKGLWVFPLLEETPENQLLSAFKENGAVFSSDLRLLGEARHVFTHLIWNMKIYHVSCDAPFSCTGGKWLTLDEMEEMPKPAAIKASVQKAKELFS